MTPEQWNHNRLLDDEIERADQEYAEYVADLDDKRQAWMKEHPEDPYGHLMFLPIRNRRTVIGIRYVD